MKKYLIFSSCQISDKFRGGSFAKNTNGAEHAKKVKNAAIKKQLVRSATLWLMLEERSLLAV